MIKEDITILKRIYEDQDVSHDNWESLERLSRAGLANVKVTYSNPEGTVFPS